MPLTTFTAAAATCEIDPGTEVSDDAGMLQISDRVFTDLVASEETRIAGTNKPALKITLNPVTGEGTLEGTFVLTPDAVKGTWEGELNGRFVQGMVKSSGIARGTGELQGSVLQVSFQQI